MADPKDPLAHFMNGLAAATELLQRSLSNGFLIEAIVLGAAVIDGCLRVGLILRHQIDTKSSDILPELLVQDDNAPFITEREVYRRSLESGVITRELFEQLGTLYSDRNRAVHRYIISYVTTSDVFDIARRFEEAISLVNRAIWQLEQAQIHLGVGMTRAGEPAEPDDMHKMADEKHAAEWLARAMRRRAI